ncbi:tail fiber assembly protein [Providencia stuartii]|uniref:tail fiber assembly protein n=1 Tax=Providencia stuartii TaxID=588 RepID=UPI0027DA91E2|nr:tail fiber assembly protein [Providencia stuartii]
MRYYKDNQNVVFAYDDEQLAQVARLSEVESLLSEKEPAFISVSNDLQQATLDFNEAKDALNMTITHSASDDECIAIENEDEIQRLTLVVEGKTTELDEATAVFTKIEAEYQPLKDEFESILPVFFDIREHLKVLKKMSTKEIEAYLNPPIPKDQLIAEAEQQKQALLSEANNAIAPLQDAVDLDMATDEEKAQLTAWKKYRVLLNRVDTSTSPEIEWPEKP